MTATRRHLRAKKALTYLVLVLPLTVMLIACCNGKYADIMKQAIQSALGSKGMYGTLPNNAYTWFQYPTNNFGIGTSFILPDSTSQPSEANQQCAMWSCVGIANPPDSGTDALSLGGFADYGDNGGTVSLSQDQKCSITVNAVLPTVYNILNINGSISSSTHTKCDATLGQVYPRVLKRDKFTALILAKPADDPMRIAFTTGKLAVAVSDYLITSMKITIHVDKSTDAGLDAGLSSAVGKAIGKDAKVSFKVSGGTNGDYTLEITKPVIIATYIKRQPSAGVLEETASGFKTFTDWSATSPQITGAYTQ